MNKKISLLITVLLFAMTTFATHNRAGEISFRHLGQLNYEVTIITYTETGNGGNQADRPFLPVDWGDNSARDSIERVNFVKISDVIRKNTYVKTHTYSGPGRYVISVEDPNRNANVQNIPNSVNVVFYIESELIIDPFAGHNNSVQLLNPPIDFACAKNVFVHNPSAYDPDGDSLAFSLVPSKGFNGVVIPGYSFPSATNSISINNKTGQLIWDAPTTAGEYNVAILIEEFKNGIRVGSVLRDMQITVTPPCNHDPPIIESIPSFCVEAGDTLLFEVRSNDRNDGTTQKDGSKVTLEATGGIFQLDNPALFEQSTSGIQVTGGLFWAPTCNEVRNSPYTVVFRAVDNGTPNLSQFLTVSIEVVAPAPQNLQAESEKNKINLNWDPYYCQNAVGFKIYRKLGSSSYTPDFCETGIPKSAGFKLIHTDSSIGKTTYSDDEDGKGLIVGLQYCYRIVAVFEDGAESYASDEVCVELKKELPVITNVSVLETDPAEGRIYLAWSKPTEHDTMIYPGPYKYVVRRKIWNENFVEITTLPSINDTIYNDTLLNTTDNEYSYIIDMYDLSIGETFMGSSVAATSVYLSSLQDDNALVLQWSEVVPWINDSYVLSRLNLVSGTFEVLDTIRGTQAYVDDGLTNNVQYCYKLESIGGYLVDGFVDPIINLSQVHCNFPIDTVAPCSPILSVISESCPENFVPEPGSNQPQSPCGDRNRLYETLITWTNPNNSCIDVDDVVEYKLFFSSLIGGTFEPIFTVKGNSDTSFSHISVDGSIAGCYYVTAIDSFGNVSDIEDTLCVDNCPYYVLPNVFTPGNKDGVNDIFRPFPYCFIESVDITIFNRWGQTVFESNDPDVNWDGINQDTGEPAADGVYFYVCDIREIRLAGISRRKIKGTVQLLNGGIK